MGTPEFAKSRNERKRVEMRFAHLKTHHGFERMRLRGLSGARDEFHVAIVTPPTASDFRRRIFRQHRPLSDLARSLTQVSKCAQKRKSANAYEFMSPLGCCG